MAGLAALEKAVVPLGVEQALPVKARPLKAVIHIGGQHEVVLVPDERKQLLIDPPGRGREAVDVDVPAPVGPEALRGLVGAEAAGIHVGKMIDSGEITEVLLEARTIISIPGGGGEPGPGADDHGLRLLKRRPQPTDAAFCFGNESSHAACILSETLRLRGQGFAAVRSLR